MTQTLTITQWLQMAIDHQQHGRLAQAEQIYRAILAKQPSNADALHLLGILAGQQNMPEEAVNLITRAIAQRPNVAPYHANLAQALAALDRNDEALAEFQKSIALDPNYFPAHYALGTILESLARNDEAIAAYQTALKIQPNSLEARNNLGIALRNAGRWDEAADQLDEANRLAPNSAKVQTNLAMILLDQARHEESLAASDRALTLEPPMPERLSGRISAMHYASHLNAKDILAQARRFDELFARPLAAAIAPHTNNRDPHRKLRIGYVSPDFRNHVVGRCALAILSNHDREQFQIHSYASVPIEDAVSAQLRDQSHKWLNIDRLDDESVADIIREDQIDILVDLTVHTRGNRLPVFARKPAPVQITYLGCCTTTGLSTIDYRISDIHSDPAEADLANYSERTIRFPATHFCYDPIPEAPPVAFLPATVTGFITFGCLNNFTKYSTAALNAWTQILQSVPNSRLILHARPGKHLDRIYQQFQSAGISPDRLEFVGHVDTAEYFRNLSRFDIALDPFPYNGVTTTGDTLWMGIPLVTLSGQTAVSRMGRCLLTNVGLPELIANSVEEYIRLAVDWSKDLDRLTNLRTELRSRLQNSPVMDQAQLTRNLESAYRQTWHNFVSGGGPTP